MKKLWCLEDEKIWEKNLTGFFAIFLLEIKWREWRGFKKRREERIFGQSKRATSAQPSPVWGASATQGQTAPLAVEPTAPTRLGPHVASWPPLPLTRSLMFFSRILGIRTPILNPFSDYEPWLSYARRQLHNFEKWLRNHLGKRRWSQLKEWEQKVA